jgi:CBS domain-containing protein
MPAPNIAGKTVMQFEQWRLCRPGCRGRTKTPGKMDSFSGLWQTGQSPRSFIFVTRIKHCPFWSQAMTSVAHILKSKADMNVQSIAPTASVYEALQQMASKNIGSLLVMDGAQVVGIFTERDYARKIVLKGRTSPQTPMHEVMTPAVMFVTPQQSSEECMALMTENRLRHLPVLQDGELVGLVSIGDLVKDIISEQQFIIEQLECYITGKRA